jgi:hypothetical protein
MGTKIFKTKAIKKMTRIDISRKLGTETTKLTDENIKETDKLQKKFFGDNRLKIMKGLLENSGIYGKYYKQWISIADRTIKQCGK